MTTLQTAGEGMDMADSLRELVAAQSVEIEQLRKDAERYRWLRDKPAEGEAHGIALMFLDPTADGVGSLMPYECDKRIDAAIQKETP